MKRRPRFATALAGAALKALATQEETTMTDTTADARPTVALVHGAFADSSGWNDVVGQLRAAGIAVQAISNPLRGISADAAYVASAIQQIPGPVLAVGHSYGGAMHHQRRTPGRQRRRPGLCRCLRPRRRRGPGGHRG